MITLQLPNSERIREQDDGFQTERRYEQGIGYEWRGIEWHSNLAEAIQAAAYRDIQSLPNEDLEQWYQDSSRRLEAYQQVLTGKLEPRFVA